MNQKDKVTVKVIAHSVSPTGQVAVTLEHEEPRIIHSEFLRHRLFSNSVASSRAIPVKTMRKHIRNKMFIPWYWGKEQSGMQAKEELTGVRRFLAKCIWRIGAEINLFGSMLLSAVGVHKQLANRNTEYISYIKVLTTGTSYENFFALRDHELAQPEIQELAKKMKDEIAKSKPRKLDYGQWHTPYVSGVTPINLEDAKKISVSCCAQTSYRTQDTSIEKAIKITNSLINANPMHSSPFEHVLTPVDGSMKGITGFTKDVTPMSGNSVGFKQMRHLLKETK